MPNRPPHLNLRFLNQPQPIAVRAGADGTPVAIRSRGRVYHVVNVIDTWRIEEGWWQPRHEISRNYYDLELECGIRRTVFRDLVTGRWYKQTGES